MSRDRKDVEALGTLISVFRKCGLSAADVDQAVRLIAGNNGQLTTQERKEAVAVLMATAIEIAPTVALEGVEMKSLSYFMGLQRGRMTAASMNEAQDSKFVARFRPPTNLQRQCALVVVMTTMVEHDSSHAIYDTLLKALQMADRAVESNSPAAFE